MSDLSTNETSEVTIASSDGVNKLFVGTDGSITVVPLVNPPAPTGATDVTVTAFGDVSSTSGSDTFYTITNGKQLTVQTLLAGSEGETGGSCVELFYDPNANLVGMTRVSMLFVDAHSDYAPVQQYFTGNGTRRMVLRRRGFTSSAREIFAQWIGYEE